MNQETPPKRVVIVTGAGAGLGRAYALDLAARNYRVVVNNRRRTVDESGLGRAERVVSEIMDRGGEAIAEESDAQDPGSGDRMVRRALETFGRLDALVANAGVDQHSAFHKITLDEFRQIMEINFFGTLYAVQAAYAHMRSTGHGRIVVSTSSAGLHGLHGLSAYASSKAALIGLMRSLALEGRSRDILCNAVAPYAATKMTEKHVDEQFVATMRPEYVAPLVAFLVSQQSGVNGHTIVAGGGRFRAAAMVEGTGLAFDEPASVTEVRLTSDVERLLSLSGARGFSDALAAFADFAGTDIGGKRP